MHYSGERFTFTGMQPLTILLADDHVIIRRGLKFILDANFSGGVVVETDSAKDMMKLLHERTFSHLILDMQLQDANILEVFARVRQLQPNASILVYTMSPEETFGRRMMQLGADGFLSKQSSEEEVIKALGLFFAGRKYISTALQDFLTDHSFRKVTSENPIENLSERELHVLEYLLRGQGVKEIAVHLDLKATTVATYKARIFDKLGVSNIIDLKEVTTLYQFNKHY
jgi:two-component system invasion response regulator UvrY